MGITRCLPALALAGLALLTGGPAEGQAPRSGRLADAPVA